MVCVCSCTPCSALHVTARSRPSRDHRRYCDADGTVTEQYPFNPNGSPAGIAALCSPNGRHLAMMPHPERCFLEWQHPWHPRDLPGLAPGGPGPWLRLFQNAREWCEAQRQ
jgi:phosphoribosylformylglycinamidine synthase